MRIRRRQFLSNAGAAALAGGTLRAPSAALAQEPAMEELMRPGPLTDLSLGKSDAPVTIIEYASMTCSGCAAFHKITYPQLKERFINAGKVRFIFREFPLDEAAVAASMLARCAGGEKTMALIEVLFRTQDKWAVRQPLPPLLQVVKQAGFTQQSFDECLKDQTLYANIVAIRERAIKIFKIDSTPTLFINGTMHRGGVSIQELEKLIKPHLKN